jgi:gas vesicle structural protein
MTEILSPKSELALSELLDRALNKGVVLIGDLTISIADVDLIYLGVKVLLSSVETAERLRPPPKHGATHGALRDAAE